jgi:MtN3 and saliva related transmembrane protein
LDAAKWVGALAATLSVASFTPQAWHIIKTRSTDGLSAAMYGLTCLGFALWVAFGVLRDEWAIIIPNTICLIMSALILWFILAPQKQVEKVAETLDVTNPDKDRDAGSDA